MAPGPKPLQTLATVQVQLAHADITRMRTNDSASRVVLDTGAHEVILERVTLEAALAFLVQEQLRRESHAHCLEESKAS